jgi:hypothetical protein
LVAGENFSQEIKFWGHPNVLSTHRNTVEITMDEEISKRADCILGVRATHGCRELSPEIRNHILAGKPLRLEIKVKGLNYNFLGRGSKELELTDPREMVFRKSNFSSPRTVAVSCNAAAMDIPREIVELLKDPKIFGSFTIIALKPSQFPEVQVPMIDFALD